MQSPERTLAIVQPLTEATRAELSPIHLQPTDYLVLGITEHRENVWLMGRAEARRAYRAGDETTSALQDPDGNWLVPDQNNYPSWTASSFLSKRIPESLAFSVSNIETRKLAPTDYTVILISSCWPRERILFESAEAKQFYDMLCLRFLTQARKAEMQAEFKIEHKVPTLPRDYDKHPTLPLADYQQIALLMGLGEEGSANFGEQGTGKTAAVIARICLEAKRQRAGKMPDGKQRMLRVLVVAPNQVRFNWHNEIRRFATIPGKVCVVRGGKAKRLRLLTEIVRNDQDCAFTTAIAGYDTIASDPEMFCLIPWDLVICDESHYFKNPDTQRWKALRMIRDKASLRRMALTGTPIANSVMDIFTQLEWLGYGFSGFTTFGSFASFHGKYERRGHGQTEHVKLVSYENVPLLQERLTRLTFSITKKEANLGLPDKVYDYYEVEMTPKQTEFYRKLRDELALEIEGDLEAAEADGGNEIVIQHILTKLLRLAQICSGFVKWDTIRDEITGEILKEGKLEHIDDVNPKIEALRELLADKEPHQKTLVWACFIEDHNTISRALTEMGIKHVVYNGQKTQEQREQAVWSFNNDPDCKVFVGNPQTAGEGLNLLGYQPGNTEQDTQCDHEIFFSQNWSYIQRSQAEDRAHRRGTKASVRITDLIVPSTTELGESIDQLIRERVKAKENVAKNVQNIRDILASVLKGV